MKECLSWIQENVRFSKDISTEATISEMLKLKITHEDLSQMMLLSSSVQSVTQTLATATAAGAKDREKEGVKAAQQRVSEQDGSKGNHFHSQYFLHTEYADAPY